MPRPDAPRRLWLVRHGRTAWNAEGRWQGSIDVPLSEEGRSQSMALGERLRGVSLEAAFASTLSRARDTARLAVEGRLAVTEEAGLCELSYGAWEGVTDEAIRRRWPVEREQWERSPESASPVGGEALEDLAQRAWRGLARALDSCRGDVLVVAHGGTNRVLVARLLGAPLASFWAIEQDPTAVTIVEMPEGPAARALARARLRLLNCTRHLGSR